MWTTDGIASHYTGRRLYSFTALQLYSFTALQLYSFTALQQNDQSWRLAVKGKCR
jgi:hypothetical protein